jgi:PilZ domain.
LQGLFDDESMMTTVEFSAPRRSARIFRKMKMQAQGRAHNGKKFRETCQTLVVSAHGGLLTLKHEVDNGELLTITNPETQEEIECRIVFLGDLCDGGQRVGVEFLTPSPRFWGLDFSERAPSGAESSAIH